ncbi:MAG: ribulose-phosphate 3-epimerase [Thermomicrobium sp.]|nr:ribulose-phosphate 3-epimerase [Thermomicrobium sp.]MDW8059170.1 ribulose-phosphate 3-epimerase [Thermomicrobium sp.]
MTVSFGHRRPMLSPSILNADFACLGSIVQDLERAGADALHLDVMDGRFVPNISFGIPIVSAVKRSTRLPLDVHLMIVEPERYLDAFAEAGATALTVHVEATVHLHRTVSAIKELGLLAGVALNPATPLAAIEEILPFVDLVLVMTVNPGFGGQTLIPAMLAKIARLRRTIDEARLPCLLSVDGGVKLSNLEAVVRAGADIVVTGSALFEDDASPGERLREFRQRLAAIGEHASPH